MGKTTTKVNGKSKGNSFERKIANLLSNRFEPKLGIKNSFRRNPDSGAFFGGGNAKRTETYSLDYAIFGDLICPKNFAYGIECKHYKTAPGFKSVVNHNVTQWDTWLGQAEQDAAANNKLMCLIVKYNNVDEIVFLKDTSGTANYTKYKHYYVYLLTDWLSLPDTVFFEIDS